MTAITIPCQRCGGELYDVLYPIAVAGLAQGVRTPVAHGYLAINCPICLHRNDVTATTGKAPPARVTE